MPGRREIPPVKIDAFCHINITRLTGLTVKG
jgi:hypothetical protein